MEATEICKEVFGAKLIDAEYIDEYAPPKSESRISRKSKVLWIRSLVYNKRTHN